jgi:hypothetical protein
MTSNAFKLKCLYSPPRQVRIDVGKRPRQVVIAIVRNEGDVISAWTSHILSLFDVAYLVDHMSMDGTRQFVLELAASNYRIHVYSLDEPGYLQAEVTNCIAEVAAREYPGSWIFPLDADEFLSVASREELLSRVEVVPPDRALRMEWRNCVPVCLTEDVEFDLVSPCLISPVRGGYRKLAMHSSSFTERGWRLCQGNHEIIGLGGKPLPGADVEFAELLHVPIRSVYQFVLKCVQGIQAYRQLPGGRERGVQGFHWDAMLEKVLAAGRLDLNLMRNFVAHYGEHDLQAMGKDMYSLIDEGWILAPLRVAHVESWPRASGRRRFLDLAEAIVSQGGSKNEMLLVGALRTFDKAFGKQSATWGGEAERKDSVTVMFERLPEEPKGVLETTPDLGDLYNFVSRAFTPHEHPLPSAWEAHVPFLFCLLYFTRPRRFVELGTHYGNCFFAACQASRDLGNSIECVAVDTWRGDEHTGMYGEEVFRQFKSVLERDFMGCGKYIRSTFDEASPLFEVGSIDLLHIDGLHTYEAVAHDFETWLPKMSDRGVVMLHDTCVRDGNFGVWRLWERLEGAFPSFNFLHGSGLGVLLVGNNPSGPVRLLFDMLSRQEYANLVKFLFENLGKLSPLQNRSKPSLVR